MAPSVPRYSQPQIQEAAAPQVRVSTSAGIDAFGGGQGLEQVNRAAQGVLKVANDIAAEEKKKADDLATQEAFAKTVKLRNDLFWDPKTGAMARKGKDAFDAPNEYGKMFDDGAQAIEESLSNEDQKAMYRQMRQREKLELDGALQKHTFGEYQKFDEETTKAGIMTQREDAVLNFQNPGKVQESIELQSALLRSNGERLGKDEQTIALEIKDAQSKTHSAIITRMLANGQDLTAKKYYDSNKDAFDAADATNIEKALEEGSTRGESQRQADAITRKYGQDMTSALAQARKIEDPKLRDAVNDRVKDYFATQKAAERNDIENLHRSATDIIDKTGSIDQIPAEQWARFSLSERSSLKSYAKNRRDGTEPETNWESYYTVKTLASTPAGKEEFLKVNLFSRRNEFADAEFKELVNLQTEMRKGKGDDKLDGFRTDQSIVNDALSEMGVDTTPKPGSTAAQKVAEFRRQVDKQVQALQKETGKKASNDEVQKIVDSLRIEGVTKKGWFWDTKKRQYELEAGESFEEIVVPTSAKNEITKQLKARGRKVTPEEIQRLYVRGLLSGN